MTFQFLDIPEDDSQLADWLVQLLVGTQLPELVRELELLGNARGAGQTLHEAFAPHLDAVLEKGPDGIEASRLRAVVYDNPALLLELQELVLTEGGSYWRQACLANEELSRCYSRGEDTLSAFLAAESEQDPVVARSPRTVSSVTASWGPTIIVALTVLICLIAIAQSRFRHEPVPAHKKSEQGLATTTDPDNDTPQQLPIPEFPPAPPEQWGWLRPEVLPQDSSGEEYFLVLADLAEEWFDERPDSHEDLALRITELKRGCRFLLESEHPVLHTVDQKWLVRNCNNWARDMEEHLDALQEGRSDYLLVRNEMDERVDRYVRQLRKWAILASKRDRASS